MRTTAGWMAAIAIVLGGLSGNPGMAYADPNAVSGEEDLPVRSTDAALVAIIARASVESATFRGMTESIRSADGIVYVQSGRCGHGVRSCLVSVVDAGSRRILWVKVDVNKQERELMGSIGHELRHALEVLGDPNVKSGVAMIHFYLRTATRGGGRAFETQAAVVAGDAVRSEVGKYRERAR